MRKFLLPALMTVGAVVTSVAAADVSFPQPPRLHDVSFPQPPRLHDVSFPQPPRLNDVSLPQPPR